MVKGIDKLSSKQKNLMKRVNELHVDCVGLDYKAGMKITEVWVDKDDIVCVRLANGEWYHYTENNTWY